MASFKPSNIPYNTIQVKHFQQQAQIKELLWSRWNLNIVIPIQILLFVNFISILMLFIRHLVLFSVDLYQYGKYILCENRNLTVFIFLSFLGIFHSTEPMKSFECYIYKFFACFARTQYSYPFVTLLANCYVDTLQWKQN